MRDLCQSNKHQRSATQNTSHKIINFEAVKKLFRNAQYF